MTDTAAQAAIELVRTAYGHFGRGDIPAMLAMMSPDITWQFVADRSVPYTATVTGRSQVAEWFGAVGAADDVREFVPDRMLAAADHVTVIGHERTIAKATGREFRCAWVHVWELSDGQLVRFFGILDSEAAANARRG